MALLAALWWMSVPAVADPADTPSPRTPLVLAAGYIGDSWLNARGGRQEGFAYVDNVEFAAHLDAQRAFGLRGIQFFASALHNNRATFSDTRVGDLTIASNIDTDDGLRLYEAWVDWSLPTTARATSIRTGLYDLNSEFDTTESRSLFVNSAYGMGQDLAQTGENGPSAFPVNAFGARIAWFPRDTWLLEFVVVDGVPGRPGQPGQPGIDFSTSQGALLIAEATTSAGPFSQISIGHWRYTASFDDLVARDVAGQALRRDDNLGTYVTAEFSPNGAGLDRVNAWTGFLRAGVANGRINAVDLHVSAGIVTHGLWPGTRGDQFGVAASATRGSDAYRESQALSGTVTDQYEYNVELTWRLPINDRFLVQPDLQYFVHPGLARRVRNSVAVGLRIDLRFEG